jgi:hypothetical protein
MILDKFVIEYDQNLNITSIPSYTVIINKFINKFIKIYSHKYEKKHELYSDAIIYSKYYLYYKTQNCIYAENIMNIIYDVDFTN